MNRRRPVLEPQTPGPKSRGLSKLHWVFRFGTLLGLAACRATPPLAPVNLSEGSWTIRHGQAVWRQETKAPGIAGELLLATGPARRAFVQFTKTPLPVVVAQTTADAWQIEFVPDHRTYSGRGQPPQLAWLQLASCLAGVAPPPGWRWEKFDDARWRLENKVSGEMLEGYLAP